jgi:hypothetical protein
MLMQPLSGDEANFFGQISLIAGVAYNSTYREWSPHDACFEHLIGMIRRFQGRKRSCLAGQ